MAAQHTGIRCRRLVTRDALRLAFSWSGLTSGAGKPLTGCPLHLAWARGGRARQPAARRKTRAGGVGDAHCAGSGDAGLAPRALPLPGVHRPGGALSLRVGVRTERGPPGSACAKAPHTHELCSA